MSTQSNPPIAAKPRLNPLAQYLMALAAVIGCYSCYLRFAVPIIEGPPNQIKRVAASPMPVLPSEEEQKSHLIPLLPRDAWELSSCKVLLTSMGTILFRDFKQLDDGSMQVEPFTMITGVSATRTNPMIPVTTTKKSKKKTPTVLRCVEGAILKFNKPMREVLAGGDAKMQSARLTGQVDIYRPPSGPEKNDAMHVLTSNVKIDRQQIYTIDNVMFSFGPNQGSGRNLLINLDHEGESEADFSNINGIKRLELAFLDKLRIEPSTQSNAMTLSQSSGPRNTKGKRQSKLLSNSDSPLEIACKGSFIFDLESNTATFHDDVVALQIDAFQDNIKCDKLTLVFEENSSTEKLKKDESSDIELKQFIAEGKPAIVMSNSRSAKISAEFLQYDLLESRIQASCSEANARRVTLVSPDYQLVSKRLNYIVPDDGSLGAITATGAGQMLRVATAQQDEFFATWQRSLTTSNVANQPGMQRVVLDGQARIRIKGKNKPNQGIAQGNIPLDETRISADQLEVLAWQIPVIEQTLDGKTKQTWQYHPAKLYTKGRVNIESLTLEGQTEKLTATWPAPTTTRSAAIPLSATQPSPASHRVAYRGTLQIVQQGNFENGNNNSFTPTNLAPIRRNSAQGNARPFGSPRPNNPRAFGQSRSQAPNQQTFTSQQNAFAPTATEVQQVTFEQATKDSESISKSKKPKTKIRFRGNSVDVQLTGKDSKENQIEDLTIVGDVSIIEVPLVLNAANQAAQSFQITGERLRLTPQNGTENYRALVSGSASQLAKIVATDFELTGQNINLNQIANKIWVEGSGTMKIKPSKQRQPTDQTSAIGSVFQEEVKQSTPDELDVKWQGGMIFDGDKIYFENGVLMAADRVNKKGLKTKLKSESQALSVELKKPIDLTQLTSKQKIGDVEMREIVFVDRLTPSKQVFKLASHFAVNTRPRPVVVETRTFDKTNKLAEQQQISVPSATFNTDTGSLRATGPGSVATHRISQNSGQDSNPFSRLGGVRLNGSGQKSDNKKPGISFVRINFDGEMQIDSERKKMNIDGRVRSVYSPVQTWNQSFNPDHTARMAPGGVYLSCEHMQIAQWSPRNSEKPTSELIATGNAHIMSDLLESTSDRVSYNEQSDTLTIDGTARTDAVIWVKRSPTDKPAPLSAAKISHRIGEQRTDILEVSKMSYSGNVKKK